VAYFTEDRLNEVIAEYAKVGILYTDYNEMKTAGNNYSSFNAEFWDVTTYGIPVWKSLVKDFTF